MARHMAHGQVMLVQSICDRPYPAELLQMPGSSGRRNSTRSWAAASGPCFFFPGLAPFWGYPIFDPPAEECAKSARLGVSGLRLLRHGDSAHHHGGLQGAKASGRVGPWGEIWPWLSKPMGSHFGVGAPPILVYFSGEYGILTHGHLGHVSCALILEQGTPLKSWTGVI